MNATLRLLVVEDSVDDAELLRLELETGGYAADLRVVDRPEALTEALDEGGWDLVVSDHNLPGFDSFAALETVRAVDPNIPFIVVSGAIGEERAVAAMQAGADDYVMKGRLARLLPAIERSLREARIRAERREALQRLEENEARLRMLAANLPGLVVQICRYADGTLTVPWADGRLRGLFGLTDSVITAESLFAPFGDEAGRFQRLFDSPEARDGEVSASGSLIGADGSRWWIDFRARRRSAACCDEVWEGLFFDNSEQKRVELEIRDLNHRLQELGARLNTSREEERSRIARELHDDLGGSLAALKIGVVMLRDRPGVADAIRDKLAAMANQVDETVAAVRRICADLHPRILDELGLAAALRWQTDRFTESTGLACDYQAESDGLELPRGAAIAVFRVYQESLTNIARHARACQVEVRLRRAGDSLELRVEDDGVGFDPEHAGRSDAFGLFNMEQRIRDIGGRFELGAGAKGGSRVRVQVPLARQ